MKVSELQSDDIDLWVARACGVEACMSERGPIVRDPSLPVPDGTGRYIEDENWMRGQWLGYQFRPSIDWNDCGPLIQRLNIRLNPPGEIIFAHGPDGCRFPRTETWAAAVVGESPGRGEAHHPLIAVCRAIVGSVYGDEVPDEEPNQCES